MQKKVRIKDIAKMAGVSSGTVDRILHNRGNVSESARLAVEKVLEKVNYKPNIHVSGLSLKRKYNVVVTTPNVTEGEYWESIHSGIRSALNEYKNIIVDTQVYTYNQYDIYSCREVFDKIAGLDMDAVIIGPTFKDETIGLCNKLTNRGIPYVFVDSNIEGMSPLAFFSSNHYICGRLMCKLITSIITPASDIGIFQATRIGDESANTTIMRKTGFTDYLNEEGKINNILKIPLSVTEPEKNEHTLSNFFSKENNIKGIVVLNSKGYIIANYIAKNNITDVKLVCVDLTKPNVQALKDGYIDFLIGQRPESQSSSAIKILIEYLIFRNPVVVENYVPLDILTKETIDYYQHFNKTFY